MKIVTRLAVGFGLVLTLLLLSGGSGIWGLINMSNHTDDINESYKTVEYAERAMLDTSNLRRFEKDIFINIADKDKVTSYRKQYDGILEQRKVDFAALEKLSIEAVEKQDIAEVTKNFGTYLAGFNDVYQKILNGSITTTVDANSAMNAYKVAVHGAELATTKLATKNIKDAEQAVSEGASTNHRIMIIISLLLLASAGLSLFASIFIARSISIPVSQLAKQAETLAEGNLSIEVEILSSDEIGLLAGSFKKMAGNLRNAILQISQTAQQVADSSSQLHSTADQIASGAEEVASQIANVATASEEMSSTSSDIAHNCLLAAETSNKASETARSGALVVRETIDGMERIAGQVRVAAKTVEELGARSDQIGTIIGTIEDIADQTNLLALNAAIEAARAGEQGRGFAVVADEVRALAERTTKATREIGEMIKAIQKETQGAVKAMEEGVIEVERGTTSSMKSGQALEQILDQINDVTMQVNQIATAAEEQTATTSEITTNIQQITDVVHATSKGAAETAAASSDLSRESEQLQQIVLKFRV